MRVMQYRQNNYIWRQPTGGTTTGDTGVWMRRSTARPSGASCSLVAPGTGCTRGTLQHEQCCVSTLLRLHSVGECIASELGTCHMFSGM